jgi:hypothetical protein
MNFTRGVIQVNGILVMNEYNICPHEITKVSKFIKNNFSICFDKIILYFYVIVPLSRVFGSTIHKFPVSIRMMYVLLCVTPFLHCD